MWIVASVPFWVVGIFIFICAIIVIHKVFDRPKHPDDVQVMVGAFMMALLAGGLLVLAAKIAS